MGVELWGADRPAAVLAVHPDDPVLSDGPVVEDFVVSAETAPVLAGGQEAVRIVHGEPAITDDAAFVEGGVGGVLATHRLDGVAADADQGK